VAIAVLFSAAEFPLFLEMDGEESTFCQRLLAIACEQQKRLGWLARRSLGKVTPWVNDALLAGDGDNWQNRRRQLDDG